MPTLNEETLTKLEINRLLDFCNKQKLRGLAIRTLKDIILSNEESLVAFLLQHLGFVAIVQAAGNKEGQKWLDSYLKNLPAHC